MTQALRYHVSSGRFEGRRALITGAAQGLGYATAKRLGAEGAALGLIDLNGDAATASARRLSEEGYDVVGYGGDVTDVARVEEIVADFATRGTVDVLVAAAGIFPVVEFSQVTMELWRKVIDVNLGGLFACTHAVMPIMKQQGYGRITAISSETFLLGVPAQAAYVASKAGVIGLIRSLAREGGPDGVTANAVLPGLIPTEGVSSMSGDTDKLFEMNVSGQSIPRRGDPDDIADAITYLSSEGAGFVTGQSLAVGGGDVFL
jgi:NAD(P)-dependent dehydrogenase (short-subunit alcohol dehydrogenase family)